MAAARILCITVARVRWLTMACSSRFKASNEFFWPEEALALTTLLYAQIRLEL